MVLENLSNGEVISIVSLLKQLAVIWKQAFVQKCKIMFLQHRPDKLAKTSAKKQANNVVLIDVYINA